MQLHSFHFTLYGAAFQQTSGRKAREYPGPATPHPLYLIDKGFGLPCSAFSRPYSPNLDLISFPAPTKMLHFGASPFPVLKTGNSPKARNPIQRSWGQSLHAANPGLSRLGTAFFGSGAQPSTKWGGVAGPP